nr:hypothetical protein [uncultured Helicobacter sp.]
MDLTFGTKILNHKTGEIGLLIKTWKNKYADAEIDSAICVDKHGKRYDIKLDEILPLDETDDFEKP